MKQNEPWAAPETVAPGTSIYPPGAGAEASCPPPPPGLVSMAFPLSQAYQGNVSDLPPASKWPGCSEWELCLQEAVGTTLQRKETPADPDWPRASITKAPPAPRPQAPTAAAPRGRHTLLPITVTTETISTKSTGRPCGLPQADTLAAPVETCLCTDALILCGPRGSACL